MGRDRISDVVFRGSSFSTNTKTPKPIVRTFHWLGTDTCGTSATMPTSIPLSYTPSAVIIKTYDRYIMKSIKVHVMPNNTTTGGAICLAYDATGHAVSHTGTNALLSITNSMVDGFSANNPRIVDYTINNPGFIVDGQPDILRYDPVGTGVTWKSGTVFLGSMSQANTFAIWIEYEVELILPREY